MNFGLGHVTARKPVPRGLALAGPAILSYGFRPFFLMAGLFAVVSMILWIGALVAGWPVGGGNGALSWHAHEMLFGYTSAALAGFMLTAIPNWTGRLPVSGLPLLGLVALWLCGRLAMLAPDLLGVPLSIAVDASFLPVLALVAGREIVAGRNWKNLKILGALCALATMNLVFHLALATGNDSAAILRFSVGVYIALIALVGGRIVPSFTRNWLVKAGVADLPRPFGRFDVVAIAATVAALLLWAFFPEGPLTAASATAAALLQALRLWRWHGWRTAREPLVLILHLGYAFIPLGLFCLGLAALGWLSAPAALHVLTVGAIANMTLAVMTRSTLGHTGRALRASRLTSLVYLAILVAAAIRPFAEILPELYTLVLMTSATCWIAGFSLFVIEYGPMLVSPKDRPAERKASAAALSPTIGHARLSSSLRRTVTTRVVRSWSGCAFARALA